MTRWTILLLATVGTLASTLLIGTATVLVTGGIRGRGLAQRRADSGTGRVDETRLFIGYPAESQKST